MQALFAAQEKYSECKAREAELESQLVALLEGTHTRQQVEALEEELEGARASMAEAYAVVVYFQEKGDHALHTDLYRGVYHSQHPAGCTEYSTDEWMSLCMRWSQANASRGITGLLMTTGVTHFGVVEGTHAAVTIVLQTIAADKRHSNMCTLSVAKIEAREYLFGLKLHRVDDDIIAAVLRRAQQDMIQSSAYAPQMVRDVVVRGGDPEGIVPDNRPDSIAVAVVLDAEIGAHHSGESYIAAAHSIEALAGTHGGVVVERFGEAMVLLFPYNFGTNAVTAALHITEQVPFAVVAIATGQCTVVAAPHCWAIGAGLAAAKELVYLAERERRPLVVAETAMERCSKAHHKFSAFTVDTRVYYTLQSIGDSRLGREQVDDVVVAQYPGMTAVILEDNPVTQYRPMTNAERVEKCKHDAVVRGALTKERALEYFRQLDPGNVGWVSKDAVKKWLQEGSGGPYHIFLDHEWSALNKWLAKQNAMAPKLLSFDEFMALCIKLEQR